MGLAMLLSLCSVVTAAELPGVSVSAGECVPGGTVTVSVSLKDNPGIISMSLDIEYDHTALVLTDVIDTGLLPGQMHTTKISSPYRLTWANDTAPDNFTVNGIVVNLVFQVSTEAKPGVYPIRVLCPRDGILNYDVENVDFGFNDGAIEVAAVSSSSSTTEKHEHSMLHIPGREATCYREGNMEYWMCTSCSKKYTNLDGSDEVTNVRLPIDPDHHGGETYLRDAVKATQKREGYTGDTYCLDCDTLLKAGKVIPILEKETSVEENPPKEGITDAEVSADNPWNNPFKDIYASDSYYDAIRYVYENGLFKGVSDTEFAPAVTMTRAMFVTVLGRMAGVDVRYFDGNSFTDAVPGEWYAPYVEWAASYGIVQGYGNGIFGINDQITVEQASAILARYAAYIGLSTESTGTLEAFADAGDVSGWAVENMKWVVTNGIYTGETNKLNPKMPASRALVAGMLYNFQNKNG